MNLFNFKFYILLILLICIEINYLFILSLKILSYDNCL